MELLSNIFNKIRAKVLFDAGYLQVLDINNGYHAIQEKDMVVCIPYLIESNSVLLRYENIPPFELVKPEIGKYVTVMSKVIESSPIESLKEGLKDKFGLILKDNINPEILTPIFINKANTARYHICILPLMSYNYEQIRPEDESTIMLMKDNNIVVNINELNNLVIYDLITRYTLDLFKKEYSLF